MSSAMSKVALDKLLKISGAQFPIFKRGNISNHFLDLLKYLVNRAATWLSWLV